MLQNKYSPHHWHIFEPATPFPGEADWHVRYTPILNPWGMTEYAAIDYGTPFVLPWSHAKTVEFLKS